MPIANTPEWIAERKARLAASEDPNELEAAATELADADSPAALDVLGEFLTESAFLARLDELDNPTRKMERLNRVLRALIRTASPEVVPLGHRLIKSPEFLADPDRKILILEALAAAAPITPETAAIFSAANDEGYFSSNACLLASNASPAATALLLEMMLNTEVEVETRVNLLHHALVPNRNKIPIIEFVGRLVSKKPEPEIAVAAIESIYDFQVHWRRGHPLPPPPWRTASAEVLKYVIHMAQFLRANPVVPDNLKEAIDRTVETAQSLLSRRSS